jgi:membrane-bound lytic murein transglycosylase F
MNRKITIITLTITAAAFALLYLISRFLTRNEFEIKESVSLNSSEGRGVLVFSDYAGNDVTRFWSSAHPWNSQSAISEYDPIMQQVAYLNDYDWRLIAAIANAESRFDRNIVSSAGAVGLMQIMPDVARQFNVDPVWVDDPYTNVELGVELLNHIEETFRFSPATTTQDRLSIILASYNCGIGHILDARRLAVKYGENYNSWPIVAKYLELKSDPAYYNDEVVKCGAFYDNCQTIGFVRKVMTYYNDYCLIASL